MARIARDITKFTRKEIDLLFKHTKRVVRYPAFDLLRAPAQKDFGRILIVTSRKVGTAPKRNKIRRQIKSIFYESQIYKNNYDWVILIKKIAVILSFTELKNLVLKGIINK